MILNRADYDNEAWRVICAAHTYWTLQGRKNDPARQESTYRWAKQRVATMLAIDLKEAHALILQVDPKNPDHAMPKTKVMIV